MGFLEGNHDAYLNPGKQVETQALGCFADDLTRVDGFVFHRLNVYYASIDKVLSELELRFSGNDP